MQNLVIPDCVSSIMSSNDIDLDIKKKMTQYHFSIKHKGKCVKVKQ